MPPSQENNDTEGLLILKLAERGRGAFVGLTWFASVLMLTVFFIALAFLSMLFFKDNPALGVATFLVPTILLLLVRDAFNAIFALARSVARLQIEVKGLKERERENKPEA